MVQLLPVVHAMAARVNFLIVPTMLHMVVFVVMIWPSDVKPQVQVGEIN